MWHPEQGWSRVPGAGPSSLGVWRAEWGGRDAVVKRLVHPAAHDPLEYSDARHPAYWRRPADVALSGLLVASPGLREPELIDVVEDDEGITLVHAFVPTVDNPGPFLARSLARFAGAEVGSSPWLARRQLRARLLQVANRGGWPTLARTPIADVADHLWRRRLTFLDRLDDLPQVAQHGDPVPGNLVGRVGEEVLAVDWGTLGIGPIGGDLGYLSLTAREGMDALFGAYFAALPSGLASAQEALFGAQVAAVFTVLTRADWALARVVDGEGALAGKFRHPSVAPYLRAMQRQYAQIESLLAQAG